jgi:hypothetical protein
MKESAIIIDIDGTLANCDHRRHFVDHSRGSQDWNSFYKFMDKDSVNKWCSEILEAFRLLHYKEIFVSGRPENYRDVTMEWLGRNNLISGFETLLMRKAGDFREDSLVKEEIYYADIQPFYSVLFAIDDRLQVVKTWRKLGIICLHCADGDF